MDGVCARSHAITVAAPRRNANGDAAMRDIRSGISRSCRPALLASTRATASGRPFSGCQAPCASKGTESRSERPSTRLSPALPMDVPESLLGGLADAAGWVGKAAVLGLINNGRRERFQERSGPDMQEA